MLRASSSRAKLEKLPELNLSEGGGTRRASEATDACRGPREGAKAGLIRGTTNMSSISEWGGCKGGTGRDGAAGLTAQLRGRGERLRSERCRSPRAVVGDGPFLIPPHWCSRLVLPWALSLSHP